jgi:Cu-Zn family superoxide dismutase
MNRVLISATILSLCLWAAGCKNDKKDTEASGHHKMTADKNMEMATANIEPTKGNNARGTVMFHQMGDKVHVVADISGLTPNAKHGFHIHEGTECGDDGMMAKGHYNPEQHQHGLPTAGADQRHAGDFGNLQADGSGKAHLDLTVDNISISGAKNPIVGHAIIVHGKPDDGSQPTGNAGARIGCGIIKAGGNAVVPAQQKDREYVISHDDLIEVRIIAADKTYTELISRVSSTGLLNLRDLPVFVQAEGLTERQLETSIAEAYKQAKIHPDTQIKIYPVEIRGNAPANAQRDSADGLALYQLKASEPAIRLSQNSWRSMFGEFDLCPVCTKADFSKDIDQVYQDAGVPHEMKNVDASESNHAIAIGTGGTFIAGTIHPAATVNFSGGTVPATTRSGSGK